MSNHSNVHGGGELDILPLTIENSNWQKKDNIETISIIRNEYLKKISKISNKKFVTDKLPENFKWIGFILNAIPESKILHLERNPMATCWSIYKSNFNLLRLRKNESYTKNYHFCVFGRCIFYLSLDFECSIY